MYLLPEIGVLLALAVWVILRRPPVPGSQRALLVAGCLLLAVAAVLGLVADRMAFPDWSPLDLTGCEPQPEAVLDYWRGQLRYGQVSELLRGAALVCLLLAVRVLPRRRRLLATVILLVPAIAVGLFLYFSASDGGGVLLPTVPGLLTLTAATALAADAVNRTTGRRTADAALIGGAVLFLGFAAFAVDTLAGIESQTHAVDYGSVSTLCGSVVSATPDTITDTVSVSTSATLSLSPDPLRYVAPVLLLWALLPVRRPNP